VTSALTVPESLWVNLMTETRRSRAPNEQPIPAALKTLAHVCAPRPDAPAPPPSVNGRRMLSRAGFGGAESNTDQRRAPNVPRVTVSDGHSRATTALRPDPLRRLEAFPKLVMAAAPRVTICVTMWASQSERTGTRRGPPAARGQLRYRSLSPADTEAAGVAGASVP
jgi:hypothetical protein